MKVTILGCGSAAGIPSVALGWGQADPNNPRNRRLRSSILVEDGPTSILVDSGPDLREQMLSAGIRRLDAIVYTHAHADHLHGIDELREITRLIKGPLPAYADPDTLAKIENRFGYVFEGIPEGRPFFRPWLVPHVITPGARFTVGGISVLPFLQDHGLGMSTIGFRFGDIVYSTDVVELPEASKPYISGVKVWILDVLGDHPYPTHVHLEKALRWIEELKPQRVITTHMGNTIDYDDLRQRLPPGAEPGFDGMVIEI